MSCRPDKLQKDATGQYYRQVGRKAGVAGQTKFRLGSDLIRPQVAYERSGQPWHIVLAEHQNRRSRFIALPEADDGVAWQRGPLAIAGAFRKH